MTCACNTTAPVICTLKTGIPTGTCARICLLSGDGPPIANPPSVIYIWIYRDNLTGVLYPWNPQTAAWMVIDGSGEGGAGVTTRLCCNLIIAQGVPSVPPTTPLEMWIQIDPVSGIIYPWNVKAAAWMTISGGTGGGVSTGNNNGMYWGNGAPATPPNNIYVDNLYVDIDSGILYWWSWGDAAWE